MECPGLFRSGLTQAIFISSGTTPSLSEELIRVTGNGSVASSVPLKSQVGIWSREQLVDLDRFIMSLSSSDVAGSSRLTFTGDGGKDTVN